MGIRQTFKNIFSGRGKTNNSVSGRDFLKYGNKNPLYPSWTEVKMSDEDMYRGYSYAVIQKRGNKVASLAKSNIKTDAKPEIVDAFQEKGEDVVHPYLKVLRDSVAFSEKQFWKNISIYLDLAGRYYLGVIRNEIRPNNPSLPVITTDVQGFVLLNPYEIRRVKNKDNELAGYIERKKDGRYREWPIYQIIEIKELNPFDNDKEWGMTDAAREAVYTLQQSGDYTRQTLNGNLDAPGIISTDVILEDEDFMNFRERIREHRKGEPIFGNGSGAIQWSSMQVDLDRAALLDINEINRTALFAVSGTSKTSLGIEQSGTTRDTARVQSEQFLADTVTPRLEDIIDYLNLDYRRHYKQEYEKSGFELTVLSASSRDYSTETQATQMRQAQVNLALGLIQSGYTAESAYQYAEGIIELSDLELKKGLSEPQSPDAGQEGENPDGNGPVSPSEAPQGGSGVEDGKDSVEEQNDVFTGSEELVPHKELNKGGGNPNHDPKTGQFTTGSSGEVKKFLDNGAEKVEGESNTYKLKNGNYWRYDDPKDWGVEDFQGDKYSASDEKIKSFEGVGKFKEIKRKGVLDYTNSDGDLVLGKGDRTYQAFSESEKKNIKFYSHTWMVGAEIAAYKNQAVFMNPNGISPKDALRIKRAIETGGLDKSMRDAEAFEDTPWGMKQKNSVESCSCKHLNSVEDYIELSGQGEEIREAYNRFLAEVRSVQRKTIKECEQNVTVNAFTEPDLLPAEQKNSLIKRLKNAVKDYWMVLFPLFANDLTEKRNREFNENTTFKFNNELQEGVFDNADTVASGHIETILGDILEASNTAYTKVLEDAAAEVIIEAYKKDPSKFDKYFKKEPSKRQAKKVIENTDILEENRRIYEKANKMALEGYKNSDITKAIRKEYNHISKSRADLIAMNETSRAFSHSQYEADKQFLNSIGKLDVAYKQLYSRTGDPCPICQKIIDMGPIPFTQNFLDKGETISADENGKVRNFTANYEAIKGGTVHVRCQCEYRLIFKNELGEFITYNQVGTKNAIKDATGRLHSEKDGKFVEKGTGEVGGSSKGSFSEIAKNESWESFQKAVKGNIKEAVEAGITSDQEMRDFWRETKFNDFTEKDVKELDADTAEGIVLKAIPENVWFGWFRDANSDYKPQIETIILNDKKVRNAGLNLAWYVYKEYNGKDITLKEFLKNEIPLYRGDPDERPTKNDVFISYTTQKDVADRFAHGSKIKSIKKRPIDTLGCYHPVGECEIFVPRFEKKEKNQYIYEYDSETISSEEKKTNAVQDVTGRLHSEKDGRFVEKGASDVSTAEGLMGSKLENKVEAFRNLERDEQIKFCEMAMEIEELPENLPDSDFQRISYALGIKDKPKVLSNEEFDKRIEDEDYEALYRCVHGVGALSAEDVARKLREDNFTYQGGGDFCDGTYFANDSEATDYFARGQDSAKIKVYVEDDVNLYEQGPGESFRYVSTVAELEQKTGMKQNTARAVALLMNGYDGCILSNYAGGTVDFFCLLTRKGLVVRETYDE